MRFLADENISRLLIERMRNDGMEVASIKEERPGVLDPEVLEIARDRQCVLITEDQDFGELVVRRRQSVAGVMLLELDKLSAVAEIERV